MRNMWRALVCGIAFTLILAAAEGLWAQAPPGSGPPPAISTAPQPSTASRSTPSPGSLAAAMLQAKAPDGQIAIAIGADQVWPPDGVAPPAGSSIYRLADLFGMLARPFGGVIAIAPSTMTILNTAPGAPNPFDGIPAPEAFKLLVGSLTPAQWQALTSAQGLGTGDLQSDDQRELFRAIFPTHGLTVSTLPPLGAIDSTAPTRQSGSKLIMPDEAAQGHIRLSRQVEVMISAGSHTFDTLDRDPEANGGPAYRAVGGSDFTPALGEDRLFGVRIWERVANTPKPGNLDFQAAALQTPIPFEGAKTVKDLIERISRATRVELYADRRYENRQIIIAAGAKAATAADLLQAMAFCLCGTYRRVGPAFVLTDDLIGVGTRRAIISEFRLTAFRARRRFAEGAGKAIVESHAVADLPARPGSITLTPDQIQQASKQPPSKFGLGLGITMPVEELSPQQQDTALKIMDAIVRQRETISKAPNGPAADSLGPPPTPDGPVQLAQSPTVDLLLPSLGSPVEMDDVVDPRELFSRINNMAPPRVAADPGSQAAPESPPSSLTDALKPYRRRAVIVEAHTASEVDSVVASMRQLGFNELWLEVFDPGVSDVSTQSELDGGDLLTEALKVTRGTGIRVLPVLRLLKWRASTPVAKRDLSIINEESPAAIARRRLNKGVDPSTIDGPPAAPRAVAVSPFEPSVQDRLTKLMANLAREPHIAGVVWRSPTIAGYSIWDDSEDPDRSTAFGYTERARLSFLRANHADPVDIDPNSEMDPAAGLPDFDDPVMDMKLREEWGKFRVNEDLSLLRRLVAAASIPEAASSQNPIPTPGSIDSGLPVLVEAERPEYDARIDWIWFGSWNGRAPPLPLNGPLREDSSTLALEGNVAPLPPLKNFGSLEEMAKSSRSWSKTAIFCLRPDENWSAAKVATVLTHVTKISVWDGVALDLSIPYTGPGRAPTSAERLAALAK